VSYVSCFNTFLRHTRDVQRVFVPVEIPVVTENPIFAPSLNVSAFDSRLGGWSQPMVGG
jgi:hypothetical protein